MSNDKFPGTAYNQILQNGYTYLENNPVMNIDPSGNVSIKQGISKLPKWVGETIAKKAMEWGVIGGYRRNYRGNFS
ncbi:MAG TPA: hypothetical protein GXX18_05710 [Bacillales bacterium]|nr:hypothetical protein [Bacillales bacterium]